MKKSNEKTAIVKLTETETVSVSGGMTTPGVTMTLPEPAMTMPDVPSNSNSH